MIELWVLDESVIEWFYYLHETTAVVKWWDEGDTCVMAVRVVEAA